MSLDRILAAIRSLHDLHRLVRALRLVPLWDEVPSDAWPQLPGTGAIVAIARRGDFPWFAVEAAEPRRTARALTRRLVARGRVAGVVALDPAHRRLAIGVAFGAQPILEVDLAAPDPAAVASIGRLGAADDAADDAASSGAFEYAARVVDALSAERVTVRFFREFRATLDRMRAGLPAEVPAEHRAEFVLLQLTRVLFLYFVQAKGWLAGRERFLSEAVDRCLARRRRIHRDLLRPLFFGTLNRPADARSRAAAAFGAVPFLNGGLFEPHALERRYRADIPNPLWRDAFDRLFEGFHFTVAERGRPESVAPDMLGRVFEGVMEPDARRATGTFYTPSPLVDRMIDAGLTALVSQRLRCGTAAAEQRLRDGDRPVRRILDTVTILDPAVGSGAFLLGALERLANLGGRPSAARKRRILQHNLFGVDRNPMAVRLAELRLWLAVIADDPTEHAEHVAPLPNLDCLVRQGDSLLDPIGPPLEPSRTLAATAAELATLRQQTVAAAGNTKAALARRLRALELELLSTSLTDAEARLRSQVADCLREGREWDLFGGRRGLDRALQARLRQLRSELRATRRARHLAANGGEIPWFHYRSHFADVFARSGGFDLIVGNPPWQRAETIAPATRDRLAARYRWWRGSTGCRNRPDLAVAFVERGVELAAPDGAVALLVPAKLATAAYGAPARHALAAETTLHTVADLHDDRDATFDATVYPLALVATKARAAPRHRVRTMLGGEGTTVEQTTLAGGGPWLLVGDHHRRALAAARTDHPRLDERFACHLGVKTGANALFLQPPPDLEPEVLRWGVRGRDIQPFACSSGIRLLWTHDSTGRPHPALPPRAAVYLAAHETELRRRADFAGGIPWALFRVGAAIARHRVVWADLSRHLAAAALVAAPDRERIPLNTCYVVAAGSAEEAECLAAWLNSTWIRAVARAVAPPAANGFARFNAGVVGALPLAVGALQDSTLSTLARAARSGTDVQAPLDAIVARHLGLSARTQAALRSFRPCSARA